VKDGLGESIARDILDRIERSKTAIPAGVSRRHAHLSREHFERLFGAGREPSLLRRLGQPGYFACRETVDVEGPKGRLEGLRLIAPHRPETQVEASLADAALLGLEPPVAGSGRLDGAAAVRIRGPLGWVDAPGGLIVPMRHLHLSPEEGRSLRLKTGDFVRIRAGIGGPRELVFERVLVRVGPEFALEFHADAEEADAAGLKTGDIVRIA
jgi:putative phosphotransacetylase